MLTAYFNFTRQFDQQSKISKQAATHSSVSYQKDLEKLLVYQLNDKSQVLYFMEKQGGVLGM